MNILDAIGLYHVFSTLNSDFKKTSFTIFSFPSSTLDEFMKNHALCATGNDDCLLISIEPFPANGLVILFCFSCFCLFFLFSS